MVMELEKYRKMVDECFREHDRLEDRLACSLGKLGEMLSASDGLIREDIRTLKGEVKDMRERINEQITLLPTRAEFEARGERVSHEMAETRAVVENINDKMTQHLAAMDDHSKKMQAVDEKLAQLTRSLEKRAGSN